ncbi:hypothetical protein [Enterococcus ureasiticus]|uniref:Uncharacterized protein n=1 Tax=Enterococcus ureasiticus TaxID=903984 RepID=A0A1E5GMZ9_9ENTE|nr:hypothetical protein [Enterococcus ureasiticus]OEG13975.1 hypothetical protein BCR21_03005 [Enterococcus ureasiticus]
MNEREQQRKFSERSTINKSTFDAMNTNQTRYSNGQGKNVLPTDRDLSGTSSYYYSTGLIYLTGVLFAILLFIFVIPLSENIVSQKFYSGAVFLLCALLFCVIMGFLWVNIGLKFIKKYRS